MQNLFLFSAKYMSTARHKNSIMICISLTVVVVSFSALTLLVV